jgi:hypothetical protein
MFFDGSLMTTGAGAGLLFISTLGKHIRYVLRLHFPASNNVAEYEALVNGLQIAIDLGVRRLDARGDSQLVIDKVQQSRRGLRQRLEHPTAMSLLPLICFQVIHIPRTHAKFSHQGRVGLASAKPDPPSRAKRGEPPLRRNFPRRKIFSARMSFVLFDYFESGS